ncbi:ABC transporter ATP-binding protein [Paenibacillus sp. YYML68]|uniref:ABC transporter ATP-binding protein n=1 Tax=Paenibacillus sp. YYML68 TaxID=2909250 RepID=UPI00285268AA|nr:ABC transporter ATP-binding protein [Paenibacillus sp. YYML68]
MQVQDAVQRDLPSDVLVQVQDVVKRYRSRDVLRDVTVQTSAGEWLGILGPNGSGKSTLLHAIAGTEPIQGGSVLVAGKPVRTYSRKQLARLIAVLEQEALPVVGFTVREVVEMGRYAYQNWLGDEESGAASERVIEQALAWARLEPLADRQMAELSGGERQRAALAKALAQQPRLLLLDEPTTYLDIGYQLEMLNAVSDWQRESGAAVISVLHDLNLAAQYCDRLLLLHEGRVVALGAPDEVLEASLLERVYGTRPSVLLHPERSVPQILLTRSRSE